MKIKLNKKGNITRLMRSLGYHPDKYQDPEEPSFSKSLRGSKFPRFHVYYQPSKNQLNLHLDQKPPRYSNAIDHGAEYDGKLVRTEAQKIKKELQ